MILKKKRDPFSLTLASFPVTSESCVTSTTIRAASIVANGIHVTDGRRSATLVNVWKQKSKKQKKIDSFFLSCFGFVLPRFPIGLIKLAPFFQLMRSRLAIDTYNRFDFWLVYACLHPWWCTLFFFLNKNVEIFSWGWTGTECSYFFLRFEPETKAFQ